MTDREYFAEKPVFWARMARNAEVSAAFGRALSTRSQ